MRARTQTSHAALATFRAAGRPRPMGAANWDCSRASGVQKGRLVDRLQKYNQRLMGNALREPRLLTSLDVTAGRRMRITSVPWEEYWGQCEALTKEVAELKVAWTALISGNLAEYDHTMSTGSVSQGWETQTNLLPQPLTLLTERGTVNIVDRGANDCLSLSWAANHCGNDRMDRKCAAESLAFNRTLRARSCPPATGGECSPSTSCGAR